MSSQQTFDFLTPEQEVKAYLKGQIKGAWYNRCDTVTRTEDGRKVLPHTLYVDAGKEPSWKEENAALNFDKLQKGLDAIKSGSTDLGKVTDDPWIGDWAKLNARKAAAIKSAGIGMTGDYSAIDVVNIMSDLLATELRAFSLEQAITSVSVPELTIKVDTWTRFTANESIGEGVQPTLKLGSVSRTTYDLVKHGGATGITFEATARSSRDIYRQNIDTLVSDIKRIKSNKVATELETATDVGSADFAAYTTDHSTTSPYDAIGGVTDTIVSNNGVANTLASHDKVFRDFIGNTHVHGFGMGPDHEGNISVAKVINNIPGLPGFTWYIDNEKTATILTVYDKKAVLGFQGPIRTATVTMGLEDTEAYRIFDFFLPKIVLTSRIRDLTSVTA